MKLEITPALNKIISGLELDQLSRQEKDQMIKQIILGNTGVLLLSQREEFTLAVYLAESNIPLLEKSEYRDGLDIDKILEDAKKRILNNDNEYWDTEYLAIRTAIACYKTLLSHCPYNNYQTPYRRP